MYNFDPYNVLLVIATNIPVLLNTGFVLQVRYVCIRKHIQSEMLNACLSFCMLKFIDSKTQVPEVNIPFIFSVYCKAKSLKTYLR